MDTYHNSISLKKLDEMMTLVCMILIAVIANGYMFMELIMSCCMYLMKLSASALGRASAGKGTRSIGSCSRTPVIALEGEMPVE